MRLIARFTTWLETRWINPAYSGWLLGGLGIFFFLAATNSMSGWLYVMSGIVFALLTIAAILSRQTLRGLQITRRSVQPVSAGDELTIEVLIHNASRQRKALIEAEDHLPLMLGAPVRRVVELINPKGTYYWVYQHQTAQRGVYDWQTIALRTAAPLGLFWCRRSFCAAVSAIVYPTILPLSRCPLIDQLGQQISLNSNDQRAQTATEGLTRSLRPYRWGDPMRMIHWRTSARYGELRVRELEILTSGQEIVIGLDSAASWNAEQFEQAVIAAASLYFYSDRQALKTSLWTAQSGLVQGRDRVLQTLAAVNAGERAQPLPDLPIVWLTQTVNQLPAGSCWVVWGAAQNTNYPGIVVQPELSLQAQLQQVPT